VKTFDLVLIRHGFSVGNLNNTLAGWTDVALTPQGITELEYLKQTIIYPETEIYCSSDLIRCVDTFNILFGHRTKMYKNIPEFREINFGKYENACPEHVDFMLFFQRWLRGEAIDDVESFDRFTNRVVNAVINICRETAEMNKHSCTVVTHSGVIRALHIHFSGIERSNFFKISVPNGRGIQITFDMGFDNNIIQNNSMSITDI